MKAGGLAMVLKNRNPPANSTNHQMQGFASTNNMKHPYQKWFAKWSKWVEIGEIGSIDPMVTRMGNTKIPHFLRHDYV